MTWPVLVASLGFLIWQFVLAGVVLDAQEPKLQRACARWARPAFRAERITVGRAGRARKET